MMTGLKFLKRGQSALEYMQTYGWAILVILVVGVVLLQLGIFSVNPEANVAIGFSKIQVLEPTIKYVGFYNSDTASESSDASVTNTFNFTIVNVAGDHIHIQSFKVGGDCNESLAIPYETCSGTEFSNTILAPDEKATIKNICCYIFEPGDFFWVNVSIEYWARVGEIKTTHTERGVIQGYVEVCNPNKYKPEACTKT